MHIVFLVFAMMTKSSPTICAIHSRVNSLIVFLANLVLALNSTKLDQHFLIKQDAQRKQNFILIGTLLIARKNQRTIPLEIAQTRKLIYKLFMS